MKLAKLVLTTTMVLCLTLVVTAQLPQKDQPQPGQNGWPQPGRRRGPIGALLLHCSLLNL